MLIHPTGRKKKVLVALSVALLVFGCWLLYSRWRDEQIFRKLQTGGEKALTPNDWLKLPDILAEKYKADNYGSTTPEGTLALFVEALKRGDAELAAKYFIPEKQPEYQRGVINWTKLNKNIEIADTLNRATGERINGDGTATMGIFDNSRSFMTIFFIKNNYSGKWKLQSL